MSVKQKEPANDLSYDRRCSPTLQTGEIQSISDADNALAYLRHEGDLPPMSRADERTLRRKIDRMIMPLMWSCYCLQYLDKTLINYANVMGLEADTHIAQDQFSYLALVFYVTYLAFEFPHGYGMQRLPTAKYLGTMVFLWGVMVAVTAALPRQDAHQLRQRHGLGSRHAHRPRPVQLSGAGVLRNLSGVRVPARVWYAAAADGEISRDHGIPLGRHGRRDRGMDGDDHRQSHVFRLSALPQQSVHVMADHVPGCWAADMLHRSSDHPPASRQPDEERPQSRREVLGDRTPTHKSDRDRERTPQTSTGVGLLQRSADLAPKSNHNRRDHP
nr:putative transporter [Quercus suber]